MDLQIYCPTVETSSLIRIPSPPGFSKNVHPYLFQQSPILSTFPSLPARFIPLSRNLSSLHYLRNPTTGQSLISNIIQRVVKFRLTDHLTSSSLLSSHQFSPVSLLQISFYRNSSFVHPRSPRQCNRINRITGMIWLSK